MVSQHLPPGQPNLIIHIQGEALKGNAAIPTKQKDPITGLTNAGGMFGEAFNLFSGGMQIQEIRKFLKENGAECYSVKPKAMGRVSNFIDGPSHETFNARCQKIFRDSKIREYIPGANLVFGNGSSTALKGNYDCFVKIPPSGNSRDKMGGRGFNLPLFYLQANLDILKEIGQHNSVGGARNPNNFLKKQNRVKTATKTYIQMINSTNHLSSDPHFSQRTNNLNVAAVFQDLTDKDNLASLAMINNHNNQQAELYLIGFRIYESDSVGPSSRKPFPQWTLNFVAFGEMTNGDVYKPADKREGHGNISFNEERTIDFYNRVCPAFMLTLGSKGSNFNKVNSSNMVGKFITDGIGMSSLSKRSPFNMVLYYFGALDKMISDTQAEEQKVAQSSETKSGGAKKKRKKKTKNTKKKRHKTNKKKRKTNKKGKSNKKVKSKKKHRRTKKR